MKAYRLRDGIRAVKLDPDGHGQFTMLTPGRIVRVEGSSSMRGFVEIVCDGERLCIFPEDLEIKSERVPDAAASTTEEEKNLSQ